LGLRDWSGVRLSARARVLTSAVGVKRPGREVGQSCLSGTEVKNEWSYPLAPVYVSMTFTGTASLLHQSNRVTKTYDEEHISI
jgi:hypothetical protein